MTPARRLLLTIIATGVAAGPAHAQLLGPAVGAAAGVAGEIVRRISGPHAARHHRLRGWEDLHVDDREARRNMKRLEKEQRRALGAGASRPARMRTIAADSRRY
jgi:hypothetical protein